MAQDTTVYDLGSLDTGVEPPVPPASPSSRQATVVAAAPARPARPARVSSRARGPRFDVYGSLSLFVPGAGQIAAGRFAQGLFFVTTIAFLGSLSWAMLETRDRLTASLALLGYPAAVTVWVLGLLFIAIAVLHLGSVVTADPDAPGRSTGLHPLLPGMASLVIPGWGQILNGDRTRAALFLALLWVAAAGWLLASPPTGGLLSDLGLHLPAWARTLTAPAVRWTMPAVVWTLAVYDGVQRALAGR